MAAFVKQENQRVLWNTVQNIDLFHRVLTDAQKPLWFKEMIGMFYEKCRDRRLSRLELENLNRQVVEYMVSSLKMLYMDVTAQRAAATKTPPTSQKRVSFQEDLGATGALLDFRPEFSSNIEKKSIQSELYTSEFSTRQQEYEQMMKRDTPPDVNFKEEVADDIIKNMDELLEQQRKQRELDLHEIPPPLPSLIPRQIQPTQSTYGGGGGGRKKLVFREGEDEASLPPVSILELQDSTGSPKFGKDAMEILEDLKKDILEIKQLLAVMHPNMRENPPMEEIQKTLTQLPSDDP